MTDTNHDPVVIDLPAEPGYQAQQLSGRIAVPWTKKINPIWWLQNDLEPVAPANYHPDWPTWARNFVYNFIRNPLSNFSAYVIGVKDRNYVIRGTDPVDAGTLADVGRTGWKWSLIDLGGWVRLPFVGYAGPRVLFYVGWAWEGNLGAKLALRG